MLVNTNYSGKKAKGKEYTVDDDVAKRWKANGIATIVTESKEEVECQLEVKEFKDMTAKELYEVAVENDLDVEQKKPKAYYIDKLTK